MLPIDHVVLASASVRWEPPAGTDYSLISVLYDPRERKMRLVLEGVDGVGTEIRSVFYWDADCSEWMSADYKRVHAMLMPLDYDETSDGEVAA